MPVRPELIDALGKQETGGESNPDTAISIKGARGRYQITPPTARAYGFDPTKLGDKDYSRNAASTILAKLIDQHKGDEREALKSYYGRGKPPPGHPTADQYADKVLKMAGPNDPLSEALAKEKEGSSDPLSEALAKEHGRPQIKIIGKSASKPPGLAEQIAGSMGVPVLPEQQTALRMAGSIAAGGPAAEIGEATLGPILGGALARSTGLGILGAAQSLAEHPSEIAQAGWNAATNFGFGVAGELGTSALTKGAAAVGPYAQKVASEIGELTPNKVKAIFHIKQFLKAAGRTPEEVDTFTRGVEAKQTFADAHQAILDETHKVFNRDYDSVLAKDAVKAANVDTAPVRDKLNETMTALEKDNRLGQLSPGVKKFIDQTREKLTPDPLKGLIPPEELASMSPAQRASYIKALPAKGAQSVTPLAQGEKVSRFGVYGAKPEAPTEALTVAGKSVDEMRVDLSQIRRIQRGRTTPTDRAVLNELHNSVVGEIDKTLTKAGSPPEDLTKLRSVDQRYRQFNQTMDRLGDPRQALTGAEAAKEMFDAVDNNNYGAVEEYVKLAKAAAVVNPKVLTDLKDAVLTKVMADARSTATRNIYGRIGDIRKTQGEFASKVPEAMETLFGKGSPMADVRTADAIFGRIADPRAKEAAMQGSAKSAGFLSQHRYMSRFLLITGTYAALSGTSQSFFQMSRQHPYAAIGTGLSMMFGPEFAKFIYSKTGAPAQRAYTDWIMEPGNTEKLRKMVDSVAAGLGHTAAQPADQPTSE